METQTHAFPSDPAGYQPQQGLTKREYVTLTLLAALAANPGLTGRPEREYLEKAEYLAELYFEKAQ